MRRPLNRFLLKLLLLGLPVVFCFELFYRLGIYPVITVSQIFDYKMLGAKRHAPEKVDLMAIGSSVTLYDLDSRMIADSLRLRYYNFGSWGMTAADIFAAARALVRDYRPANILLCSSPRDFMTPPTPSYAEYAGTAAFIRERFPEYFYLRNYNPIHTLLDRRFVARRPTFDAWGGALVEEMWAGRPRQEKVQHLDFPNADTELQYRALDSLCRFLRDQEVRLFFVQVPMKERFVGDSEVLTALKAHFDRCRSIVEADGGYCFVHYDPAEFPDSLFADLTHLNKAGTKVLTRKIVADIKEIIQ
jgi:hypothetical protein